MNRLDKHYQDLLQDILDNGVTKKDRTGTGTISLFGKQIRHKMSEGFPLLTTKKMPFRLIVTELLWFLRGDTNIKYLVDNDCHIWDGDALKAYHKHEMDEFKKLKEKYPNRRYKFALTTKEEFIDKIKTDDEFAKKWGELGPVYGKQWRGWTNPGIKRSKEGIPMGYKIDFIDQIENLINDLKTNPDSRRLMINSWNVGELDSMVLPPCHYGFQVYTRELSLEERSVLWNNTHNPAGNIFTHNQYDENEIPKRAISLMWAQRSVDTFLGLPFNIASYGLLLEIIAKEVNMVPDELIGNLGDTHLYLDHIEQAREQIGRELSDEERYNIWFNNNYETGMERFFDPNNLPNFDDPYYEPTPKRTREPFSLPELILDDWYSTQGDQSNTAQDISNFLKDINIAHIGIKNYQAHPHIKAPLSN